MKLIFLTTLLLLIGSAMSVGYGCSTDNCKICSALNVCGICNTNYQLALTTTANLYSCTQVTCTTSNCVSCYVANKCQQCAENFFVASDGTCTQTAQPTDCPMNCLNCANSTSCSLCAYGYNLIEGYCYQNITSVTKETNCLVMLNTYTCQVCKSGYMVNNMGYCETASTFNCNGVDNCATCSAANNCTSCIAGYTRTNSTTCTKNTCTINGCAVCNNSTTCTTCSDGYLLSSDKKTCSPTTWGCSGVSECTQCWKYQSCATCTAGFAPTYVPATMTWSCKQYPCNYDVTNCEYCVLNQNPQQSALTYMCGKCNTNYLLVGGYCVPALNSTAITCGVSNCAYCSVALYCASCNSGYYLKNGGCVQANCGVSNCATCSFNNYCQTCNKNYAAIQGSCYPVSTSSNVCNIAGCSYCSFSTASPPVATCVACASGYTLANNACTAQCSVANCFRCTNSTTCGMCNAGFTLSNNACTAMTANCSNCMDGSCKIDIFAATTTSVCSQCMSGFILYNGNCYNSTCDLYGCKTCATWGTVPKCLECNSGLVLNMNQCIKFKICSIYNCVNCVNDECVGCAEGFYVNSRMTCSPYPEASKCSVPYCTECSTTSNKVCSTCATGYTLFDSGAQCVCKEQNCQSCTQAPGLTCNKCPYPLLATETTDACSASISMNNNCTVTNCETCYSPKNCSVCMVGYTLSYSTTAVTCVANKCSIANCDVCDPYNLICYTCAEGYAQTSLKTCKKISATDYSCNIDGCALCNAEGGCQACLPFFRISGEFCLPNRCNFTNCQYCLQDSECTQCDIGYYMNKNGTCLPQVANQGNCTIDYCIACELNPTNNVTFCTFCEAGYQIDLESNTCVPYKPLIDNCKIPQIIPPLSPRCLYCDQGYGLTPFQQCQKTGITTSTCDVYNCLACFDDNECSLCLSSSVWSNVNGLCLATTICPDNCATCTEPTLCQACNTGFTVSSNKNSCLSCNVTGCTQCSTTANTCTQCGTNWVANTTANTCTCPSPFTNTNGTCACAAGTLYIDSNKTCLSCNISYCATCSAANNCSACATNYFLDKANNVCIYCNVANCNNCTGYNFCTSCTGTGVVPSSNGGACVTCNPTNCLSCSSNNVCAVCNNGFTLSSGKCFQCNVNSCIICSADNTCSGCASGYRLISSKCVKCSYPCATCNSNGTCATCVSPAYSSTTNSNNQCYTCTTTNCLTCLAADTDNCTACASGYTLNQTSDTCYATCMSNCVTCADNLEDVLLCSKCIRGWTPAENNLTCLQCDAGAGCIDCYYNRLDKCTECTTGYYLNSSFYCQPCGANCLQCNADGCVTFRASAGSKIITQNGVAGYVVCPPTCSSCGNNPQQCTSCYNGYYLSLGACLPCSATCRTCTGPNSNNCSSCYSTAFFVSSNNTCQVCDSNCLTCSSSNTTQCLSCVYGMYLNGTVCQNGSITNCLTYTNSSTCALCNSGYSIQGGNCVPCLTNCRQCSTNNFAICVDCGAGFYLNGNGTCSSCPAFCSSCGSVGCSVCNAGFFLTNDLTCAVDCTSNCLTCSSTSPSNCTSCLLGYTYNATANTCTADPTGCAPSCSVCPMGYVLNNGNCSQCTTPNCNLCLATNTSTCTICNDGFYLNSNGSCTACMTGCTTCSNGQACTTCSEQYTSSLGPVTGEVICQACVSPCLTCSGSPSNCLSCISSYHLNGWKCQSNFYFGFNVVLNTTLANFYSNYDAFITAIAAATGASTNQISMNSITTGSVNVNGALSTNQGSGSNGANSQYNSLGSAFSGGKIAGMDVTSSSVTVNGGNLPNSNDNLPLILGICIPVGIILIVGIIVIVYCKKKKSADVIQDKIRNDNSTVRETFELSKQNETDRKMEAI